MTAFLCQLSRSVGAGWSAVGILLGLTRQNPACAVPGRGFELRWICQPMHTLQESQNRPGDFRQAILSSDRTRNHPQKAADSCQNQWKNFDRSLVNDLMLPKRNLPSQKIMAQNNSDSAGFGHECEFVNRRSWGKIYPLEEISSLFCLLSASHSSPIPLYHW